MTEHMRLRLDAQLFNVFNHPNFGLPSLMLSGIPAKLSNLDQAKSVVLNSLSSPQSRRNYKFAISNSSPGIVPSLDLL